MKNIKALFAIFFICSWPLLGQEAVNVNKGELFYIGKNTSYYVDSTHLISPKEIIYQKFTPVKTNILNLGNITSSVWIKFTVTTKTENDLFLQIETALIENLEIYELENGQLKELFKGGFYQPFNLRPIGIEKWLFNINMIESSSKTIYIKGFTGYPFQIPISISSRDRFVTSSQNHNLFWGFYIGVLCFALLYNFFIFLSVRERTYFYYILYIIGSVIFYLGLEGYGFKLLWPQVPEINARLPIAICFTNIVITLFANSFLKITKKQKLAYYWSISMILIFALIAVANFFVPYGLTAGLAQMASLIVIILYIYMGISAWIKKVPTAKYFLLSWLLFLVFVFIFILALNNVLPSTFFTTHGVFIGHMTEVLLLSFALADRINWLKKENEAKQIEIISQLEVNEKIQAKANLELEEKVKERTLEVLEQRNEALKQKDRSDELLLNILPKETAEELKLTGKANARLINDVTVIFTDIKDFTRLSEDLDPQDLVHDINECFSAFDEILGRYNVEKIKTIGDSYMAVGGLPSPNHTHAFDVVNAAFEIQAFMIKLADKKIAENKKPFEIRLGIHTGPVVAGVVGVKKFAYDIWGNTVNIASRIESSGEIRKINISESTYQIIKDQFNCTARGKIEAKNMNPINMYFVEGKK